MKTKTRFLKWALAILVSINLVSCEKDSQIIDSQIIQCEEHIKTSCQIDSNKTNIRIKNNSIYDFCNVTIDPLDKIANYGIIKSGETTCYIFFDKAYSYAYVQLYIGDDEFLIQPIDFVGEQELGVGNFTYSIDVTDYSNNALSISTTQD